MSLQQAVDNAFNSIVPKLYTGNDVQKKFDDNFIKVFATKKIQEGFTNMQMLEFFHRCQLTGADPRKDNAYLVGYKDKKGAVQHAIIFSYHFMLTKANATGELRGVECVTEVRETFNPVTGNDERQLVAIAKIHRKGNENPTVFEAFWDEFAKMKFVYENGKKTDRKTPASTWAEKPRVMLQKCAIANALRWAFPEVLGQIFIKEENKVFEEKEQQSLTEEEKSESIKADFSEKNDNQLNFDVIDAKSEQKTSFSIETES